MTLDDSQQKAIISDACARNSHVEIHRQRVSGELLTFGGRFMHEHDGRLGIAMKRLDRNRDILNAGNIVTIYIVKSETVYSFLAEVCEVNAGIAVNDEKATNGIWIKRLGSVAPRQRRDAYRTQVSGGHTIRVQIHLPHKEVPGAAAIDAKRFQGTLVEGSASGLGVLIKGNESKHFTEGSNLHISFRPDGNDEEPFSFLAEIRHRRALHESKYTRLGLRLIEWPDRARYGREKHRYERFVMDIEREQRRRMAS